MSKQSNVFILRYTDFDVDTIEGVFDTDKKALSAKQDAESKVREEGGDATLFSIQEFEVK